MPAFTYDMLVIGSGPAGQRAAIQAAKLNKRVAMVERKAVIGGVCINNGTITSKTMREAVLHLSGYRLRGLYGASYTVKQNITMEDLLFRTDHVIRHEIDVTRHQLMRNRIEVFSAVGVVHRSTHDSPRRCRRAGSTRRARRHHGAGGHRHWHRGDARREHPVRWTTHLLQR